MTENNVICLRRTSAKPYPIKGAWSEENGFKGASPATRATITKLSEDNWEVQVYHLRGAWFEYSKPWDNIRSLEEAKQWLVDHYGGKWCKD